MNINDDIFTLDEQDVSILSEEKPEPSEDIGLTEQVVKTENPRLTGDDEIKITGSPFIIGKEDDCDFIIQGDTYISRKHCRIVKRSDGFYIKDLDSTNGTLVDGKNADTATKLEKGQEIQLADRNYVWDE